jgi:GNAT superfamily N-acetyltransferase
MSETYRVRRATLGDIPALVAYRRAMFESMGIQDSALLDVMCGKMNTYLGIAMPTNEYVGWVAEVEGRPIASGGVVIHNLPPGPRNLDGREGYIMNVYTVPEWRGHGVATAIMQVIMEYLSGLHIPVATLHASEAGRPIYEKLGFRSTNEMRLALNGNTAPLAAQP